MIGWHLLSEDKISLKEKGKYNERKESQYNPFVRPPYALRIAANTAMRPIPMKSLNLFFENFLIIRIDRTTH